MPLMSSELYEALKAAGVPEEHATRAAVAVAQSLPPVLEARLGSLDGRMTALEGRLTALEGRLTTITWMIGLQWATLLAGMALVLSRLP